MFCMSVWWNSTHVFHSERRFEVARLPISSSSVSRSVGRLAEPAAVRLASARPPACWVTPQRPLAEWNTHLLQLITRPSLSLKSNQMCVLLKRQVAHYIMRLLISLHLSPTQQRPLSVWMPPAVLGGSGEWGGPCLVCHTSSSSAEAAEDLGSAPQIYRFLCICELLHQLQPPSVRVFVCISQCLSPFPARPYVKSVCGPRDMTRTVLLTVLLLICSQHSGGGLGPAEEELGRRGRGSPEVLLQGNLSDPPPPPIITSTTLPLTHARFESCSSTSCEGCMGAMFDSWSALEVGAYFTFGSQCIGFGWDANTHTNRTWNKSCAEVVFGLRKHTGEISKIFKNSFSL